MFTHVFLSTLLSTNQILVFVSAVGNAAALSCIVHDPGERIQIRSGNLRRNMSHTLCLVKGLRISVSSPQFVFYNLRLISYPQQEVAHKYEVEWNWTLFIYIFITFFYFEENSKSNSSFRITLSSVGLDAENLWIPLSSSSSSQLDIEWAIIRHGHFL